MALGDYTKTVYTEETDVTPSVLNNNEDKTEELDEDLGNATSSATANELIRRDSNGRARVSAPSSSTDIARKAEVDTKVSKSGDTMTGSLTVEAQLRGRSLTNDNGYFEIFPFNSSHGTGSRLQTWYSHNTRHFRMYSRNDDNTFSNIRLELDRPGSEIDVNGNIIVQGGTDGFSRLFWGGTSNAIRVTNSNGQIDFIIGGGFNHRMISGGDLFLGGDLDCRDLQPRRDIISPWTQSQTTSNDPNVYISSGGFFRRSTSALKYKKDIENLWFSVSENILNLRPIWYRAQNTNDDNDPDWSYVGLIAEEVDEIEPRLVHYKTQETVEEEVINEDGETEIKTTIVDLDEPVPEGVQYARLAVFLLPIIKDLRERVINLEEEIKNGD